MAVVVPMVEQPEVVVLVVAATGLIALPEPLVLLTRVVVPVVVPVVMGLLAAAVSS